MSPVTSMMPGSPATSKPPPRAGAKFPTKPRKNFPRSRAGCLTCRQRKKKCDEVKPCCAGCARNKLECTWPVEPAAAEIAETKPTNAGEGKDSLAVVALRYGADTVAVSWSTDLHSFVGPSKPLYLTPISGMLLRHYIAEGGPRLTVTTGPHNVGMTSILPLAYMDDLVMHSILAIGGTMLALKQADPVPLETATESHYACLLRGVRSALQDLQQQETTKVLRMLMVLVLTATYEALTATCGTGGMFAHLRAARQLISWLQQPDHAPRTADEQYILGFLLELYVYLVVDNSFIPYGLHAGRHIPFDDVVLDPSLLSCYDSFGMVFSGLHELFGLIASVSQFAARRLEEGPTPSSDSEAYYEETRRRLVEWVHPPPREDLVRRAPHDKMIEMWITKRCAIGETYRSALYIFLETAMLGSTVPSDEFQASMQVYTLQIGVAVLGSEIVMSAFAIILLWPLMVAGSVVLGLEERKLLIDGMTDRELASWNAIRGAELLQKLWDDDDPRVFGPYGLYLMMEKHGINLCLS